MKKADTKTEVLFDLSKTSAREYLEKFEYPWEALKGISDYIISIGEKLSESEYERLSGNIWVHRSVKLPPTASLNGPLIIEEGAEIRHCAFIRGSAVIGKKAVIGNSCEIKNSIIFDEAQIPHYNYIGDSIVGYKSHMGASSLTSNLKSDKTLIKIRCEDGEIETGLKKIGGIIGDEVEVGCGSVLNPGTVIGKKSNIYPLSGVRGCVDSGCIYKKQGEIVKKNEK